MQDISSGIYAARDVRGRTTASAGFSCTTKLRVQGQVHVHLINSTSVK